MPHPRLRRLVTAGLLTAGAVGMACASSTPAVAASGDFRILDDRVTESSGLVLSRAHPHTVWTTNDSGDSARLFAVDTRTGRTTGEHTFGAPVTDVEALAITPQGRVLVADIGDNARSREVVRVFWFDEPGLGETRGSWASWELTYPDGPHDAESIAVEPRTGRVVIVTKSADGAVYALPSAPSRQGVNRLQRLADAPATATDAVFLADGSVLAVRTYTQLVLLDTTSWQPLGRSLLPLQPQGETIALAPDGEGLLVGSEGGRSLVQEVGLPQPARPSATPSATSSDGTPTPATGSNPATGSPSTPAATATDQLGSADATTPPVNRAQLVAGIGGSIALVLVALFATWLSRRAQRR